jgi:hypothetical protein
MIIKFNKRKYTLNVKKYVCKINTTVNANSGKPFKKKWSTTRHNNSLVKLH